MFLFAESGYSKKEINKKYTFPGVRVKRGRCFHCLPKG